MKNVEREERGELAQRGIGRPRGASPRPGARLGSRGFSLVEIMVTLTIISLLAALATPALLHVKRRAVATAIGNDLRVFGAAFDTYAHEAGAWPAEVDAGEMPAGMNGRLNPTAWGRTTPIGGRYNWENNQMHAGTRYRAAIAISSAKNDPVVTDADLFEAIDRVIDDGNLSTGNFRLGSDDEPVFIIAP